jgi:hypothetical protein
MREITEVTTVLTATSVTRIEIQCRESQHLNSMPRAQDLLE